jgi:hypothetical protein
VNGIDNPILRLALRCHWPSRAGLGVGSGIRSPSRYGSPPALSFDNTSSAMTLHSSRMKMRPARSVRTFANAITRARWRAVAAGARTQLGPHDAG